MKIFRYSPVKNKAVVIIKSSMPDKSLYSLFLNHLYKNTGIANPPQIKMLKIKITIALETPKKAPNAPRI